MTHHGRKHPRMSSEMWRRLILEKLESGTVSSHIGSGYDKDPSYHSLSIESASASSVDVGDMQIVGERSIGAGISHETDESIFEQRDVAAEEVQTTTTVVATVINIILQSGSRTIAEYTVPTLPAVVSDPTFGLVTVPADTNSPITVTHMNSAGSLTETTSLNSSHETVSETSNMQTVTSETTHTQQTAHPPSSVTSSVSSASSSSSSASTTSTTSITSSSSSSSSYSSSSTSSSSISSSTSSISTSTSSSVATRITTSNGVAATASTSVQSATPSSSSINTSKVIGGVVGGVGGAFLLLLLALLFLHWKKKRIRQAGGVIGGESTSRSVEPGQGSISRSAEMTSQRSSNTPLAAAGFFGRWRHSSPPPVEETAAPSERGFQKISGRKIPSVLRTGGDGYGGGVEEEPVAIPGLRTPTASSAAPPPGFSSPISPQGPSSAAAAFDELTASNSPRGTEGGEGESIVVMRPSPARTPTASSVNVASLQSQPAQPGLAPLRPDALGRSLSNYDGSRGSRFTESI